MYNNYGFLVREKGVLLSGEQEKHCLKTGGGSEKEITFGGPW